MNQTREQHIQWCKDRAIAEFDFYAKTSFAEAKANGLASMASDLRKHEETNSAPLMALCIMQGAFINSRQEFVNFINGFN